MILPFIKVEFYFPFLRTAERVKMLLTVKRPNLHLGKLYDLTEFVIIFLPHYFFYESETSCFRGFFLFSTLSFQTIENQKFFEQRKMLSLLQRRG